MMRKVKRLLCGALAALLIFGGALAEEGGADAEAQAAIEAQQRAEQEAREQAEREAREKAEREAKEKAEQEAREKAEREAKEKAEREAKEKAEREAKEKAEREAKEKAEREAKEKAEREAKEKAEREAKEKAEREAKEKAAQEAAPKQEQETKAEKPKEDKPEEKPVIKEDKQEEKPAVKEEKQEEKPAVKEEKQEEKPAVKEDKSAVIEDRPEEKPAVKEDKQEDKPAVIEDKPEEAPAEATERAPEPVPEDQPEEGPAEETEDDIAPDAAEEPSEEFTESSPEESPEEPAEEPTEPSGEAMPDAPAEASAEECPPVIEEAVEGVEALAADESAQSRADAQAAPPSGGTASPEPIALPEALATEVAAAPAEIALVPEASKGVTGKDGVYQVASGKKAADATLSFPLNYAGDCTGYKVSVVDAQGNVVYSGAQAEPAFVLDLSAYQTGSYVLVVEAVSGDAVVAWGQYAFALASGGAFPGGFPGGGFPGGGFSGRGGTPDGAEEGLDQGFQVTPGEALADSHTSGTKDLQLYGTVSLTLPDGAMTELILGGASLGIVLDGGREAFTAAIDGDRLTLTADGSGVWSFNGLALKILSDSGIDTLVLENREGARDIATGKPLAGDVYARLCAAGVASSAYDYQVSDAGTRVFVDGRVYRVDESGAMIPMEGDGYAETMGDPADGAA